MKFAQAVTLALLLIGGPSAAQTASQRPDSAAKLALTYGELMATIDAAKAQGVAQYKLQNVSGVLADVDKQAQPQTKK